MKQAPWLCYDSDRVMGQSSSQKGIMLFFRGALGHAREPNNFEGDVSLLAVNSALKSTLKINKAGTF